GRYNVRVMPWVMFTDSSGMVRASSLVTHAWQIEKLRRLAGVPLASDAVRFPLSQCLDKSLSALDVAVLAAKAGLAFMLVVAGSAKLAEVSSFAATVRVFVP